MCTYFKCLDNGGDKGLVFAAHDHLIADDGVIGHAVKVERAHQLIA